MEHLSIVHLSDLHFAEGKEEAVWDDIVAYINDVVRPHAILVTGDVTDNATELEFKLAKRGLGQLRVAQPKDGKPGYQLVPGNHDRYDFLGNHFWRPRRKRFRLKEALFEKIFKDGEVVTPKYAVDLNMEGEGIPWKVRIIGLDSNKAQWFAQGAVTETDAKEAAKRAAAPEAMKSDLVIALVHHHLLSIPEIEESAANRKDKRGNIGGLIDVANVTGMLNSGTLLRQLSNAQVNLVLHGHEHARFQGLYRAATADSGPTVILGAGSGTGELTGVGWSRKRVHFNIIELHPDRSVRLSHVVSDSDGTNFVREDGPLLLSGAEIRRAKFARRYRLSTKADGTKNRQLPLARLKKLVVIGLDRDARITESSTDYLVGRNWSLRTANSSGYVEEAAVTFEFRDSAAQSYVSPFVAAGNGAVDEFNCGVPLQARSSPLADRITANWTWHGAIALSSEELDALPDASKSGLRAQGREFVGIRIEQADEFQVASLTLHLPDDYAPLRSDYEVYFEESAAPGSLTPSRELTKRLEFCGHTHVELRIPYPLPGHIYYIAWRPPSDLSHRQSVELADKISRRATELFGTNLPALMGSLSTSEVRAALYCFDEEHQRSMSRRAGESSSPPRIDLSAIHSRARAAIWGVTRVVTYEQGHELARDEALVAYVPVRPVWAAGVRCSALLRIALLRDGALRSSSGELALQDLQPLLLRAETAAAEIAIGAFA